MTLTPRQAISPSPQARAAQTAVNANSAASVAWPGVTGVPANIALSPWSAVANGIGYQSGAVGIGTASPAAQLHVSSNNPLGTTLRIDNPANDDNAWSIRADGSNSGGAAPYSFHIRSEYYNVARLSIDDSGNVGIGNSNPTQRLTVNGNVLANNVAVPSSGRFKHNVAPISDALAKLLRLDGVTFDWNAEFAKDRPGREHDIGFVAEDVAKVFPEVVFYGTDGKVIGMDYSRLTAVAVQAIKQQNARFESELKKRDEENAELKSRLERLEMAFKALPSGN